MGTDKVLNDERVLITPPGKGLNLNPADLWRYRELLYFLVWKNIKVRYKQTAIGAAWAVIQPFLTMLVFSLFFGKMMRLPSEGMPYPLFYYSALLPWIFFSTALSQTTNAMVENQRLITKVYFPRIYLPVSAVLSVLVDFVIAFLILVIMMFFYGIVPGWNFLLFPLFVLVIVIISLGVGLWFSALNALYRDFRYTTAFIIQFWMFASPVIYSSRMVPEKWQWLYGLNPMVGVIDGFRWAVLGKGRPPGVIALLSFLITIVILIGGIMFFQKMESSVADRV